MARVSSVARARVALFRLAGRRAGRLAGRRAGRRAPSALAALAIAASGLGCQSILGIEDTQVTDGPTGRGFTFSALTTAVALPLDGAAALEVAITRNGGFDGEVTVKPTTLPSGLVAPAITIAAGQSTGVLSVGAVAPLVVGAEVDFELEASAPDFPARTAAIARARVTGKPGTFDTSFGALATGLVAISLGNDDNGSLRGMHVSADKKLMVVGYGAAIGGRCAMTRVLANGTVDAASFASGSAGILRFSFDSGSSGETPRCVAVGQQTDGRYVSIGDHRGGASFPPDVALTRVSVSGAIADLEFGNNGKSRVDLQGLEETFDGLVLRDNRLLAVGVSDDRAFIMRATANGALDPTFATAGSYKATIPSSARGVAIDKNDRIVVAGWVGAGPPRDMLVVRFLADGQLDPSFGAGGTKVMGAAAADERAVAVAIRPDGRILIAGHSDRNGNDDFELRQLLDSGEPDPDFGTDGVVTAAISPGAADRVADLVLLPNGEALVAGNTGAFSSDEDGNIQPVVARFDKRGALDKFFSNDGIETAVPIGTRGSLRGAVLFDNHKVILSGGNEGGTPGPGTFGVLVRMWM